MVRDLAAATSTARFEKKREAIVAAATDVLNRQGVKGMTLAEVAAQVGLNTTSVTYYFRKKEDLAAACFLAGIERITAMIREAAALPEPKARMARFVELFFQRHAQRRAGEGAPLVTFMDIRTLEEPHLGVVNEAFASMVRQARELLVHPSLPLGKKALHARTFLLLEHVFWCASWLMRYDVEDYPRVHARMTDILAHGLPAAADAVWPPRAVAAQPDAGEDLARETFLIASTRLVNRLGYRGASVEKISAELNVTKGSFYHHNETKDELVVACSRRTNQLIRAVQRASIAGGGSSYEQLAAAIAALTAFQASEDGPLLRTSALNALPEPMRSGVVERAQRATDRFAAMVADGIADGSIRAVDPTVAAQTIKISLSAAAEVDTWVKDAERDEVVNLIALPSLFGLLTPRSAA